MDDTVGGRDVRLNQGGGTNEDSAAIELCGDLRSLKRGRFAGLKSFYQRNIACDNMIFENARELRAIFRLEQFFHGSLG